MKGRESLQFKSSNHSKQKHADSIRIALIQQTLDCDVKAREVGFSTFVIWKNSV